jgi:Leucine carboxyl methyltransferase/Luciferase-like monooxygenase
MSEFGISVIPYWDSLDRTRRLGQAADQAGLRLVGIQDHPYQSRFLDTFALVATLLAETRRISFFTDVANLPLRPPAVLAKAAASLDLLSGGRWLEGVRVFEVDHPASQATKLARLRRLLGEEPPGVRFVPVDFTRDDLAAEMTRAGHDEGAATLFIWSGVSAYLPEEAVAGVLSWVGAHTSARTSIVFDAVWASAVRGESKLYGAPELRRLLEAVAEPLRWGIPDGEVAETLERFGLRAELILDDEHATAAYLTRTDGSVVGRPYGFGVLLHARVSQGPAANAA